MRLSGLPARRRPVSRSPGQRSAAGEFSLGQLTFLPGDRAD